MIKILRAMRCRLLKVEKDVMKELKFDKPEQTDKSKVVRKLNRLEAEIANKKGDR